jgi:hypothetical protein
MLKWEEVRRELDALEAEIKSAVLELGKTQTVGNVRATFSAGRKSYDYQGAWLSWAGHEPEAKYAKTTYDYKAACDDFMLGDVSFSQGEPSVTVKMLR